MNKNNFLYCFDENYNKQALISIISLLDNLKENKRLHYSQQTIHKSVRNYKK